MRTESADWLSLEGSATKVPQQRSLLNFSYKASQRSAKFRNEGTEHRRFCKVLQGISFISLILLFQGFRKVPRVADWVPEISLQGSVTKALQWRMLFNFSCEASRRFLKVLQRGYCALKNPQGSWAFYLISLIRLPKGSVRFRKVPRRWYWAPKVRKVLQGFSWISAITLLEGPARFRRMQTESADSVCKISPIRFRSEGFFLISCTKLRKGSARFRSVSSGFCWNNLFQFSS